MTRRHKRKPATLSAPLVGRSPKPAVSGPRPPLSRQRKWAFRAVAVVLSLLFLPVLEGGLRLAGYGYSTAFLIGPDAKGVYTSNPRFGWRFFPRAIARMPEPCFLAKKSAAAVRIFVLGGSAAQGVPAPRFGCGRILETMLRQRHPGAEFEVVNAAMTAINSHVAVEIARDCAAHQPDLFVVYMGNNEVVGPYGPGTVFQNWSPSLKLIRANVWLKSFRVGQLLGDVGGWLRLSQRGPSEWRGMEMFLGNQIAADDPRLTATYDNFRRNLAEICAVARRAGGGLVLATVAVNLEDCPPFASLHRRGLSAEALANWKSLDRAGGDFEAKKQWSQAVGKYEAARRIDDRYAELSFRLGRCLAALGRRAQARDRFAEARDLDALRFRADSRINAVIRDVAAVQKVSGVRLADAERLLAAEPPAGDGVSADDLFHEHVHLTFAGNYRLARAILEQVEAALPQLAGQRTQVPIPSKERCAELLGLTPWDEYEMAKAMKQVTSQPPFTNQLDHAARQVAARKRVENLAVFAFTPEVLQAARENYQSALKKSPDNYQLHLSLAKVLMASGQPRSAAEQFRMVLQKVPWEPAVWNALGDAAESSGQPDEAIASYQKAVEIDPAFALAHHSLAVALANCGRSGEAVAEYRRAVAIDPTFALAYNNLGNCLRTRGQFSDAIGAYQKAIDADPAFALPQFNLAIALNDSGRIDDAIAHYRRALEIDPGYAPAHNNLGNILRKRGQIEEAIEHFRKAVKIDPKFAAAHFNLGISLIQRNRIDEAIAELQEAVEISPDDADARALLEKAKKFRDSAAR